MRKTAHVHPADVHGVVRLAADATGAVTDIVEAMHSAALRPLLPSAGSGWIPGVAYSGVRGVAKLVGGGVDLVLPPLTALLGERAATPQRDTMTSVLSGVIGDHLAETGNPLAVKMELRRRGIALVLERDALATSLPRISSRIVVLVHGLCGTDAQWKRAAVDYPATLESEFGFTPVYLRYNSGLHISTNGRRLAGLLEALVREWPVTVEEVLLVGHSMGGLLARSAVHHGEAAAHSWTSRVKRVAFLGSPHHGAPLERGGNWFEEVIGALPYAGPLARLGRLRSAGVTDLRHGNLLDEDWQGTDRFLRGQDRRRPLALPAAIDFLAVAATTGTRRGDARDRLVGDGLVPVSSALGHHPDPARALAFDPSRRHVVYGTHHMGLLGHAEVWKQLSQWLRA
ncbi:MAG: esterase/lipase family protein [Candidatus Binatia bacterium]